MLSEDLVLKACRAYEQTHGGIKPIFGLVAGEDFQSICDLLRNCINEKGEVVIGPYKLRLVVNGKTIPGAFMVTHQRIQATAQPKFIKALKDTLFHARVKPGGVRTR